MSYVIASTQNILIFSSIYNSSSLDDTDFTKYELYGCENTYDSKDSLNKALSECREDKKCSMVVAHTCDDSVGRFSLCGEDPNIRPSTSSCTYRKKGSTIFNIKLHKLTVLQMKFAI